MIPELQRILYPVDLSGRSKSAAAIVKTWVDRLNASLETLHVIDRPPDGDYELPYLMERRRADLRRFSDLSFGKDMASCTVLTGHIADQIEYFASTQNIDLIMLPRDHQSLAARLFHDSLTATLLERCTALIWTSEHIDEAPVIPRNILCSVHFSSRISLEAQNDRMLRAARELVIRFQAEVSVLHVTEEHRDLGETDTRFRASSDMEVWKSRAQSFFGNSVRFVTKTGAVITAIRETAQELDADLIVLGRTQPETISLGRQTRILRIDHETHRPVLSVW